MIKNKIICFIFISFTVLPAGCSSLPQNVTREEYNKVRDYVSIMISGMPYLEIYDQLKKQEQPKYYYDRFGLPYSVDAPGSDFDKYNEYMMEISNKINQLSKGYNLSDKAEDFYPWAVRNYHGYQ
jgi:hypothetical protein